MTDLENQKAERLSAEVENALARIEKMEDANILRRMHENIHRHPDLDDIDRERLNEATMLRLRVVSPAIATRLGGPKDADGRDFLQKLHERTSAMFDLSDNKLGQGVKTGGPMINGTLYVYVYVSYKSFNDKNLSFAWIQKDFSSTPYLELLLRHVGKDGAGELLSETFTDPEKAVERYLQELARLIGPQKISGVE